ncbi:hypothetical protein [Roseomonas sp. BN140053]|uniref:hypothetical protein n=1 Tax=Roseomonas sp. BN140053 TaxID=3391898 RepID=UPI0039E86467
MAFNPIPGLWKIAQRVDRAFEVQEKHGKALERLTDQIAEMQRRLDALELREEVVIAKAQGAAAAAATSAAAVSMADLARRLGAMEERGRMATSPQPQQLPPPQD